MTQGDEFGLVARLEGEGLIELKPDSVPVAPGHDRTDPPGSSDTCHGLRVVETTELGNVKSNGQPLLLPKTTSVNGTGKSKPAAGNVDHQTERAGLSRVLPEPHGPLVAQSLFASVVCRLVHMGPLGSSCRVMKVRASAQGRNRRIDTYCLVMDLKNAPAVGDHRLETPGAGQT